MCRRFFFPGSSRSIIPLNHPAQSSRAEWHQRWWHEIRNLSTIEGGGLLSAYRAHDKIDRVGDIATEKQSALDSVDAAGTCAAEAVTEDKE